MNISAKFDHFNFNVSSLEKSIEFYNKALGLEESHRKEAKDGSTSLVMYWEQMKGLDPLKDDIHLPGWDSSYTQEEVRELITAYGEIGEEGLWANLEKFLKKVIPVAAGMAGGSSDAASVMYGVNRLFKLGLTTQQLMERGVKIGADVPYCIMRGTALSEGIGEKLTRLPAPPKTAVLVAKPPISVSTKFVYENLHLDTLERHPDVDAMVRAIEAKDLQGIADNMENVLETVTVKEYPVIEEIKQVIRENGAINALMSGSGPTVFGLFRNKKQAEKVKELLREKELAKQVFVTEFYNPRNEH